MANYESKSENEIVETVCPECNHRFNVDVQIDVEVESPDPYITIRAIRVK